MFLVTGAAGVFGVAMYQPSKIRSCKTSTGFPKILRVANLLPLVWTFQYHFFFQVSANFFFIVMTTGQELGH
jgi:hypothetical protein